MVIIVAACNSLAAPCDTFVYRDPMKKVDAQDKRLIRSHIIREIRQFFFNQGFIETDTPSLVLSPGMEPHIRALKIENSPAYLPTSPEFAMKKLLGRGYDRIFQICKSYRFEPKSDTHNPEFSMLEWYRGNSHYNQIMDDVEALFVHLCHAVHGAPTFESPLLGKQDLSRPWQRFSIQECFDEFANRSLKEMMPTLGSTQRKWEEFNDEFFRVFLNEIEPALSRLGKPVIVYDYPASQAALATTYIDADGYKWARRFEVYAGGFELGNAFDELTNSTEQRERFENDMKLREELYGSEFPPHPIDDEFIKAVGEMPPSGGIAMGVDRIVMYLTSAKSIEEVLWLPSHWNEDVDFKK